jgi:two-component system, cell cycle response regulator CpdR
MLDGWSGPETYFEEATMARILLADDEMSTRVIVEKGLIEDGHHVVSADDGAAALAKLVATPNGFDVLVTDIQMPEMDGLTLAEHAIAAAPGLRIILMSGYAEGFQRAERLRPRLSAILTKPVSRDDLRGAIAKALKA